MHEFYDLVERKHHLASFEHKKLADEIIRPLRSSVNGSKLARILTSSGETPKPMNSLFMPSVSSRLDTSRVVLYP